MAEITVNLFDPESLRRAAQEVRAYQTRFERRQEEFLRRLGEAGVQVAKARFDAALMDYDGEKAPIEVHLKQNGNAAELIASGRIVAFLEFGTGVSHPEHSTGMFHHGTYGKGYGKRKKWGFYDADGESVLTSGNDPAEAMTGAVQEMSERVREIAREVFGSD